MIRWLLTIARQPRGGIRRCILRVNKNELTIINHQPGPLRTISLVSIGMAVVVVVVVAVRQLRVCVVVVVVKMVVEALID